MEKSKTNNDFVGKLPRKDVFIYSLGYIPNTFLAGVFMLMYVNFYWNYLGLIDSLFIVGMVIYATINALKFIITFELLNLMGSEDGVRQFG